ncbi:MAG TPA: hypothetical protein VHZ78_14695 [Rhizomicrobium sp.]|nr:hypothetical protein [Rhizomicrobium sp.]
MHRTRNFAMPLVGLMLLATALPAFAEEAVSATSGNPVPDQNKLICHSSSPVTGTRLNPKKICATRREWSQFHNDSQGALSYVQVHTFFQPTDG